MFARLGRVTVHHPVWVVAVWLLGAVAVALLAPGLPNAGDESSFLPSHYESVQALKVQEHDFAGGGIPAAIIVIERGDGASLAAADRTRISHVVTAIDR